MALLEMDEVLNSSETSAMLKDGDNWSSAGHPSGVPNHGSSFWTRPVSHVQSGASADALEPAQCLSTQTPNGKDNEDNDNHDKNVTSDRDNNNNYVISDLLQRNSSEEAELCSNSEKNRLSVHSLISVESGCKSKVSMAAGNLIYNIQFCQAGHSCHLLSPSLDELLYHHD